MSGWSTTFRRIRSGTRRLGELFQTYFSKRDSAKLAQEQSAHLFLCVLISDLTQRYGPVVRQAKVIGVLDAAFDVLIPEFGIEKRVHVDQMPIDVSIPHSPCARYD